MSHGISQPSESILSPRPERARPYESEQYGVVDVKENAETGLMSGGTRSDVVKELEHIAANPTLASAVKMRGAKEYLVGKE